MAQLSPSPPCKPPYRFHINFFRRSIRQGTSSHLQTLQTAPFIPTHYFRELFFHFILFSCCYHNLNFHTQSALIQPQFLRMHPPDTGTVGCGKPTKGLIVKAEKIWQRGERDNTRKTENSMPTFKSFLLPPPINSVTWFILPEEQPPGFT